MHRTQFIKYRNRKLYHGMRKITGTMSTTECKSRKDPEVASVTYQNLTQRYQVQSGKGEKNTKDKHHFPHNSVKSQSCISTSHFHSKTLPLTQTPKPKRAMGMEMAATSQFPLCPYQLLGIKGHRAFVKTGCTPLLLFAPTLPTIFCLLAVMVERQMESTKSV